MGTHLPTLTLNRTTPPPSRTILQSYCTGRPPLRLQNLGHHPVHAESTGGVSPQGGPTHLGSPPQMPARRIMVLPSYCQGAHNRRPLPYGGISPPMPGDHCHLPGDSPHHGPVPHNHRPCSLHYTPATTLQKHTSTSLRPCARRPSPPNFPPLLLLDPTSPRLATRTNTPHHCDRRRCSAPSSQCPCPCSC